MAKARELTGLAEQRQSNPRPPDVTRRAGASCMLVGPAASCVPSFITSSEPNGEVLESAPPSHDDAAGWIRLPAAAARPRAAAGDRRRGGRGAGHLLRGAPLPPAHPAPPRGA